MDGKKLSPQELIESLRQEVEQTLSQVAEAVNSVPDGHVIRGSEHQVKDLMDRLRSRVFEQVLQMKADAVEASFSLGGGRNGAADAEQGPCGEVQPDGVRLGGVGQAAVACQGGAVRGSSRRRGIRPNRGHDQRRSK